MIDFVTFLARVSSSPVMLLYVFQALTYVAAAALSRRAGHHDLCVCYGASALLYSGFAACHVLHVD